MLWRRVLQGQNMNAANLYAVLTILATVMMAPVALLVEGGKASAAWAAAVKVSRQPRLAGWGGERRGITVLDRLARIGH